MTGSNAYAPPEARVDDRPAVAARTLSREMTRAGVKFSVGGVIGVATLIIDTEWRVSAAWVLIVCLVCAVAFALSTVDAFLALVRARQSPHPFINALFSLVLLVMNLILVPSCVAGVVYAVKATSGLT